VKREPLNEAKLGDAEYQDVNGIGSTPCPISLSGDACLVCWSVATVTFGQLGARTTSRLCALSLGSLRRMLLLAIRGGIMSTTFAGRHNVAFRAIYKTVAVIGVLVGAVLLGAPSMLFSVSDASAACLPEDVKLGVCTIPIPLWESVPSSMVVEATSSSGAPVSFSLPTAETDTGTRLTVTCSAQSGSEFPLGTTAVSCAAGSGSNAIHTSFEITVQDTTKPTVNVPANMNVTATGSSGAVVTFQTSSSDIVDDSDPVSCQPGSGSTYAPKVTSVTCSATDHAGNTGNATFSVTVTDPAPALHLPADQTAQATGANGSGVNFTVTATDTVDTTDPVTCSPSSGSTFPIGATTVSCSATNKAGMSAHGTFTVTVTPPVTPTSVPSPDPGTNAGSGGSPGSTGQASSAVQVASGTCTSSPGNAAVGFTIGGCGVVSTTSKLLSLVIERQGNGAVTSSPAGIDCGTDCVGTFAPGTKLTLHIKPDPGFALKSASGSCATVCRLTLKHDQKLVLRFTALRHQIPLTFTQLAVAGSGDSNRSRELRVSGRVGAPISVSLRLAPIATSGSAITKTLKLKKGRFTQALALPATLPPGSYLLALSGRSTAGPVADFDKQITIAGPTLGILRSSWITPTRDGKPESPIHTARKLWAYFQFTIPPPETTRLEVTWYGPGGHAALAKNPSSVIETFVEAGKPLPTGTWKCVLTANGKPIATATTHLDHT
jgi:HYR domain